MSDEQGRDLTRTTEETTCSAASGQVARLCASCNQPSTEWLNEIATVERERREAWAVAAQRRSEARRYYVAWQSARMRAAAALREPTP